MIYHPILSGSKGLKSFISFTESEMSLKEEIFRKAAKNPKRILFPEGEDERILQAASELAEKGIGESVVLVVLVVSMVGQSTNPCYHVTILSLQSSVGFFPTAKGPLSE